MKLQKLQQNCIQKSKSKGGGIEVCDLSYNIKIRKAIAEDCKRKLFKTIHESFLRIVTWKFL